MSMAAKSSDLVDKMSGANLQVDGHVEVPTQSVKDLWEPEEERSHQTIMHMIRKLGEDKKANWPSHLAEIVHAYNATQSAVTGCSPHYMMFG